MVYHDGILHESRVVQPLSKVAFIIFRQPGVRGHGYLQFIVDDVEPRVGDFDSVVKDPFTFAFDTKMTTGCYCNFADVISTYTFVQEFIKSSRHPLGLLTQESVQNPEEQSSSYVHIDELKTISDLYAKGRLTQAEYESLKQDILMSSEK